MKVTYAGNTYECALALRNGSSVRLLDNAGYPIATFEGVLNYGLFTLTDGDWTDCPSADTFPIAVVGPGGTIMSSGKKCSEVGGKSFIIPYDWADTTNWTFVDTVFGTYYVRTYTAEKGLQSPEGIPVAFVCIGEQADRYIAEPDVHPIELINNSRLYSAVHAYKEKLAGCFAFYQKQKDGTYNLLVDLVSYTNFNNFGADFFPDIYVTFTNKLT